MRWALLGVLLCVAGCQQQSSKSAYLESLQVLDMESHELERAVGWHDYVKTTFLPDGFYPFEQNNVRGVAPKTKEEAAEEVQKAVDYLARPASTSRAGAAGPRCRRPLGCRRSLIRLSLTLFCEFRKFARS
jgi:hypothetical protein